MRGEKFVLHLSTQNTTIKQMETNTVKTVAETTVKKVKTPRRRDYMVDYYYDLYTDGSGNCYSDADSGL